MPKVSVVIPTYNCAKYLPEAIDSVLNQTYQDFEIIVVDDGSTDNTVTVLQRYIQNNSVVYIYQKNQGVSTSRNKGINKSTGEYICFLDADDVLFPESIRKRVNFLDKHKNAGAVFADYVWQIDENIAPEPRLKSENFLKKTSNIIGLHNKNEIVFNKGIYKKLLGMNNPIHTNAIMLRKCIVEDIGFFKSDMVIGEDVDYWLRVAKKYEIGFIDEILFCYKHYRGGSSKGGVNKPRQDFSSPSLPYIDLLKDKEVKSNKEIQRVLRRKISWLYFNLGNYLYKNGNKAVAKRHFIQSLKYNLANHLSWQYLITLIMPRALRNCLSSVKRWILRVFSEKYIGRYFYAKSKRGNTNI